MFNWPSSMISGHVYITLPGVTEEWLLKKKEKSYIQIQKQDDN